MYSVGNCTTSGGGTTGGSTSGVGGVALVNAKVADGKLRDKVAALLHSVTNDNNRTMEDIRKQREEEIQSLGQRFNKHKEMIPTPTSPATATATVAAGKDVAGVRKQRLKSPPTPPPPPPPAPLKTSLSSSSNRAGGGGNLYAQLNKRRSCKIYDLLCLP